MARHQTKKKKVQHLHARPSRARRGKVSSGWVPGLTLVVLLGGLLWFFWPAIDPVQKDSNGQAKARKLSQDHPDAEVFDIGESEKKK